MPRKLPPFVECWRDRHGKLRIYFRRARGRRIALPDLAAPDFDAGYTAALVGTTSPRPKPGTAKPGTIAALVTSYMKSGKYIGLRNTSKRATPVASSTCA
ncbi:MAG: hypothetical protein M5U33_13920 [Pseudorhodoplanes sp.]|nr:hypothetical protein [Pseudorhodoplanes sp.]